MSTPEFEHFDLTWDDSRQPESFRAQHVGHGVFEMCRLSGNPIIPASGLFPSALAAWKGRHPEWQVTSVTPLGVGTLLVVCEPR